MNLIIHYYYDQSNLSLSSFIIIINLTIKYIINNYHLYQINLIIKNYYYGILLSSLLLSSIMKYYYHQLLLLFYYLLFFQYF